MILSSPSTTFHAPFSDELDMGKGIHLNDARLLFDYFSQSPLFRWRDGHNDCEDRANAICILLDAWGIPNYKGWVFSGFFIKKNLGSLIHAWNFHVATLLPVLTQKGMTPYILDPSTSNELQTVESWAREITAFGKSFYFIKKSSLYIFPPGKIEKDNWYPRNKRNYNWTLQGLSGINGRSSIGKAYLTFNKKKLKRTEELFKSLKTKSPFRES